MAQKKYSSQIYTKYDARTWKRNSKANREKPPTDFLEDRRVYAENYPNYHGPRIKYTLSVIRIAASNLN